MSENTKNAQKNYLVLHGPNLNLLGNREPDVYGKRTLNEVNRIIEENAGKLGVRVECRQSNHEGMLIDWLHEAHETFSGVVYNPAAHTHYSYALRDAIASIDLDVVEVHLSNINEREGFRSVSVMEEVCVEQISGRGVDSYVDGLAFLVQHHSSLPSSS
ncbi:MAG: type II 3-dehydroquinate dehydratase [Deltaproteobacteria bacterium]|nr:type II 3-dehydroquinate dehydratase [Deltaproteobacteria bacterium]